MKYQYSFLLVFLIFIQIGCKKHTSIDSIILKPIVVKTLDSLISYSDKTGNSLFSTEDHDSYWIYFYKKNGKCYLRLMANFNFYDEHEVEGYTLYKNKVLTFYGMNDQCNTQVIDKSKINTSIKKIKNYIQSYDDIIPPPNTPSNFDFLLKDDTLIKVVTPSGYFTDKRDNNFYSTIHIGNKEWMAENLRYNAKESFLNPNNPNETYGRLYTINSLRNICPKGWHLPSDEEWDNLEIAHGMERKFINTGGWRGKHAIHMRTIDSWDNEANNTNTLGFSVLPAGYYTSGKLGLPKGFEGLGFAAAFWSSTENNITTARFMFSQKTFVNKWEDNNNNTHMALSCRCVKDQ